MSMNIANFVKNFAPVLLLTASACGHHVPDDPVDIIPADAQAVAVYDLRLLSHAAGSTTVSAGDSLSDGTALALKMFLPANLGTPVSQLITAAAEGFDTSRLVCFTAAGGYTVAAMKVTDADAVSGALAAYRDEAADFDGFDVYNVSRRAVALSESLCIIAPDAATIRDNLRTSDSRPISEITGIKEFTGNGDNAVSVALPARAVGVAGMQGAWLCTGVRFTSDAASVRIQAMQPDGTPDSIGASVASPLDPDVLQFIPEGTSVAIASGAQPAKDPLIPLERLTGKLFPAAKGVPATGTTAYYGRPAGTLTPDNLMDPDVWNLATLVQLPDTELPAAMQSLADATGNRAVRDRESGQMVLRQGDTTVSYGYVDGYFTEAYNGIVTAGNSNSLTQTFSGARMAAVLDAPLGSQLQKGAELPCGASLSLKVTTWDIRLRLSLYGSQEAPLRVIARFPAVAGVLNYLTGASLM